MQSKGEVCTGRRGAAKLALLCSLSSAPAHALLCLILRMDVLCWQMMASRGTLKSTSAALDTKCLPLSFVIDLPSLHGDPLLIFQERRTRSPHRPSRACEVPSHQAVTLGLCVLSCVALLSSSACVWSCFDWTGAALALAQFQPFQRTHRGLCVVGDYDGPSTALID
jgi:hypothetical protein